MDIEINGTFMECVVEPNSIHFQFDDDCYFDKTSLREKYKKKINETIKFATPIERIGWVFAKHDYAMEGSGFECSVKITNYEFSKDFLKNPYSNTNSYYRRLSQYDCLNLIKNQKCHDKDMKCANKDSCYYQDVLPEDPYPFWWDTKKYEIHECIFQKKILISFSETEDVLSHAVGKCKPKDFHCILPNSIVIWDQSLIHECKFELILSDIKFQETSENIIQAKTQKLSFYMTKEFETDQKCGDLKFTKTSSNLYIILNDDASEQQNKNNKNTISRLRQSKNPSLHLQSNDIQAIKYAEEDYTKVASLKWMVEQNCALMLNSIRPHLDVNDKFLILKENSNNKIILYTNNGLAYLPMCAPITKSKTML